MRVVIAGELPLAEDLLALCVAAGHQTSLFLVESLQDSMTAERLAAVAAAADVALESHNELKAAKQRVIELLMIKKRSIPDTACRGYIVFLNVLWL